MRAWRWSNGEGRAMSISAEGNIVPAGDIRFLQKAPIEPQPPPASIVGPWAWLRENLFSSPFNVVMTILTVLLLLWLIPDVLRFLFFDAVWTGSDRTACVYTADRQSVGACWPFVYERFNYFVYGSYPVDERWRVDIFFAMLAFGVTWMLWLNAPRRGAGAVYFFIVLPIVSFVLLNGWGVSKVDTALWGGALVTIVVATVGIVAALPIGICLALGRRSRMPTVRTLSVIFIEFVRGVPLITVLFMASVMLPLFVPDPWSPNKLVRALVGVGLFAAAYMAEVVRAGLAAIPRGQFEGAMAVGLGYSQMMRLIILPQALKITIPNIVNTFIGLFKDTTLVSIVGLFDLLGAIEASRVDPKWAAPTTATTGYAVAAIFYFIFCYGMSRYARATEARLAKVERR
jgi:general L-amino acid transport system permease protein